jgi:multidrug efflux pump subunit AcrA (membrane-fusion protein)
MLEMDAPEDDPPSDTAAGGGDIGYNPLKETLARAEEATTALRANYTQWARIDVDNTQALLDAAKQAPEGRREQLDLLYAAMHNIKGQGSSFGYPLVTRLGQSLCRLIAPGRALDDAGLKIAQAHLDALKLVLDQKIAGKGGEVGDKLAARLESLTGGER